jgi:RNA polymerase sigma-70 factor (ECF subfamily)
MSKEKESQLVEKLISHDEKALFSFYKLYKTPLYNFIYKKLGDKSISEELIQDIFLEFIESLRDFRYQCSLKTFLFTIARNKSIDYIRKKKIKRILFSALPSFVVEGLASVVMDVELEKKEIQQKIESTLHKLPHEYQIVLRLKYMENKSVDHISDKLVKTFKSTESLLFRARKAFVKVYLSLQ